ncbi:TonB-dependent siderophore receptor [Aquirhabdus sp.]|uniref:TonB-dependent siderophore receptor n=1 Tax=Aquirhabdus sp. TaxID=2824160 RepID=UPI00396CFE3E
MSNTVFLLCPLSAAMILAVSMTSVYADDSNDGATLPTITVTASTKTKSDVLTVPQAVSVVSAKDIDKRGAQGLDESLRYTAGVVSGGYGADPRSDWILVRGYSPARFLDGLALPTGTWTAASRIEPYGLESIEVDKGPSSVMFGQQPPGGMISMVSKKPREDGSNEVVVTGGSFDQREISGDVGGRLNADGSLLYRVVGVARNGDTNIDHSKDNRYYLAPSLTWKIDDATSLTVLSQVHKTDTSGTGGFLPSQGTTSYNPYGKISSSFNPGEPDYDTYKKLDRSIGYEFSHQFNDAVTLKQNLRYQQVDVEYQSVGALGLALDGNGQPTDYRTLNRYTYPLQEYSKVFAMDNQVAIKLDTAAIKHAVLVGVDYLESKNDFASGYGSAPTLDIFNPVYGASIVTPPFTYHTNSIFKQTGLYVQDQATYGRWGLTIGGRHDWVKNDIDDEISATTRTQNDNAFSGRVGLNYLFESGVAPYVAYSHSFQTQATNTAFDGSPFKPLTGDQIEAGVKYQPNKGNTLFTAAVYELNQKNALTVDPNHLFYSVQMGETRTRGVELEVNHRFDRNLTGTATYTYTDAKVTKASIDDPALGKQVALLPKQQFSLSADYAVREGSLAGLGFGGGVRYVGDHYGDSANLYKTSGYTLVDANAHYDIKDWRLQLSAANLLGKEYISACNSAAWCYYGYPRTFVASVRYRF